MANTFHHYLDDQTLCFLQAWRVVEDREKLPQHEYESDIDYQRRFAHYQEQRRLLRYAQDVLDGNI